MPPTFPIRAKSPWKSDWKRNRKFAPLLYKMEFFTCFSPFVEFCDFSTDWLLSVEQFSWESHLKQSLVLGNAVPVFSVKPKWGWYAFWLFFKIGLCSAISFERSRREFSIGVAEHGSIFKNKRVVRNFVIFQDRPMFSHIIRNASVWAFHWCGWPYAYVENYENTHNPRFSFIPKTGAAFPITGVSFLLWEWSDVYIPIIALLTSEAIEVVYIVSRSHDHFEGGNHFGAGCTVACVAE